MFPGRIAYAALTSEQVDWTPFDYVSLDHYREERVKDSYTDRLAPLLRMGKPVVVIEFGMGTYRVPGARVPSGSG